VVVVVVVVVVVLVVVVFIQSCGHDQIAQHMVKKQTAIYNAMNKLICASATTIKKVDEI